MAAPSAYDILAHLLVDSPVASDCGLCCWCRRQARGRPTGSPSAPAAPAAILAKPSILRAPPGASAAAFVAAPAPTGTLWEPTDSRRSSTSATAFRASTGGLQRQGSGLAVNTRASLPSVPAVALASPSDRRSPAGQRKTSPPPLAQQPQAYRHAPPRLPSTRVKLVTPALQFATDLASTLGGCLEASNLAVVGVLGLDGVGKSTVLSLLARDERAATVKHMFPPQSLETAALARSETLGVDLAIIPNGPGLASSTSHRHLVLLDAQPVLSGALLADQLAKSETSSSASIQQQQQQQRGFFNPPAALSAEQQIDVASHQLAVFLASVCHYVIVVHDALASEDPEDALVLVRFMRGVQQKLEQSRLPHISGAQVAGRKHVAKLLFVANNTSVDEVTDPQLLRRHLAALEAMWDPSLLVQARRSLLTPIIVGTAGGETSNASAEMVETPIKGRRRSRPSTDNHGSSSSPIAVATSSPTKQADVKGDHAEDEGVPVFLLPHNRSLVLSQPNDSPAMTESTRRSTRDSRSFDASAHAFRRFVCALPADPAFLSGSSLVTPSTLSAPLAAPIEANARPLTLREWLSNASRVFDAVRKSGVFTAEYAVGR